MKVQCSNLNFFYGDDHILKDVNIGFEEHTVTALIGPSGCGKSTFLRCLNRMNDLVETSRVEGKITIDDLDIYNKKVDVSKLRKTVGMVFQKPNPFPKSIYDNVAYGLKVNGVKNEKVIKETVEKALRKAAIWEEVKDKLKKPATALSGGQQQRLCIARTLAVEPSVILMDEPASALDPISMVKIEELIYNLREKYTIIIVTHNMQQASRTSDKTAFFYMGELVEYDDTNVIFTNPGKAHTQRYITGRFG